MFRIDQIISATRFIRSFREIAKHLAQSPEPLLITQKNGRFLVVMDGELFDGLISARHQIMSSGHSSGSRDGYDIKSE
jgi:hypothetical protein